MTEITPFRIEISQSQLDDLSCRLDATRWPERETVDDWSQGAPLDQVQALCAYWRTGYDWRRCESMLNSWPQFKTEIDDLAIHFLHVRSPEPDAVPLLLTHGWPGSVIEFHKVIGPLSDPRAHGASSSPAFHLVIPSLPGYGFSDRPRRPGWNIGRIADAWVMLMHRLGYDRFFAQGGDWGSAVTTALAVKAPPELAGIHLNFVVAFPDLSDAADWTEEEAKAAADWEQFSAVEQGYSAQQRTRPQTLGYALTDSPAGQAAWIFEKFRSWTDCEGDPLSIFTMDELLDDIMLYWLPATATSSARLYWESMATAFHQGTTSVPTGCTIFPREIVRPSRRQAEQNYHNIVYWSHASRGGHFAALEQPETLVEDIRATVAAING